MKNPFKRIKHSIMKRLGGRSQPDPAPVDMYPELSIIWPNGTWSMAGRESHGTGFSRIDYDLLAQSVILDVWAYEQFAAAEARAGHELNPGMFGTYPDPIPSGWRPSERGMKALFAKKAWDVKILHYMVGELTNMKAIRP